MVFIVSFAHGTRPVSVTTGATRMDGIIGNIILASKLDGKRNNIVRAGGYRISDIRNRLLRAHIEINRTCRSKTALSFFFSYYRDIFDVFPHPPPPPIFIFPRLNHAGGKKKKKNTYSVLS